MILLLRFGIGSMFLWFGIDKWLHAEAWFGYLPWWLYAALPFTPETIVAHISGFTDIAVGMLMVTNKAMRTASVAAFTILALGIIGQGITEEAVRDAVIAGACIALFVEANNSLKKPLSNEWLPVVTGLYIFGMFILGTVFLKNGN